MSLAEITPHRCPVCWSTRCLAGEEYALGKEYGHRWEDGPMAAAHARWKDERTPPASPEEAVERGLVKPEVEPEPATDHTPITATDHVATDNPTHVATDNLRPCIECGTTFEAKRRNVCACACVRAVPLEATVWVTPPCHACRTSK